MVTNQNQMKKYVNSFFSKFQMDLDFENFIESSLIFHYKK